MACDGPTAGAPPALAEHADQLFHLILHAFRRTKEQRLLDADAALVAQWSPVCRLSATGSIPSALN